MAVILGVRRELVEEEVIVELGRSQVLVTTVSVEAGGLFS
jgi:hypothetical protein